MSSSNIAKLSNISQLYENGSVRVGRECHPCFEEDVRPRTRVHGVEVKWPKFPSGQELKVTWDLEPREEAEKADERAGLKKKQA